MKRHDRWRETPPEIDDPALAEFAAKFMAGTVATVRRSRYSFDGARNGTNGRRSKGRNKSSYRGLDANRR